jgi:transposase
MISCATPKRRNTAAITASGTSLVELFGVRPIIACMLIGYSGDIDRFGNHHRYAAYNGTAPIEVSSGGRVVHRLSRRGNRQLNHALHMAAVSPIRHAHSDGRAFFDRKITEGKTKKQAASSNPVRSA